jgi:DNA-binding IscR family transcriptional regulator
MKRDSRLSSMLHALLHLAHAAGPLPSETLAKMLRTHPVVVRRTLAGLRERGLVAAGKGHGGGWVLARPLEAVTLYDVYESLGEPALFALGNRSEETPCLVEQAVNAALDETFAEAQAVLVARLEAVTLAALSDEITRRHPGACEEEPHAREP